MKKRRGLTLIELLLTLALVGIIIVTSSNLFYFGSKTQGKAVTEFNIQSNVRLISQSVNNIIRDSSGLFLLDKVYPDSSVDLSSYLTEGWNYVMLSKDKTKLIEWVWDEDTEKHYEKTIIESHKDLTYDLTYNKKEDARDNRLLEFSLDISNKGKIRNISSELEGVNTLQIIDRSYGGTANTIAYRNDARLTDIGIAQAAVSFVIDKSGSMGESLSPGKTRLEVLKEEATKMVEGLSEYENIYLSMSPFSTTANSTSGDNLNKMLPLKTNKTSFINNSNSIVNKLVANGGTNTGDGMRRGLGTIVEFNNRAENSDKTTKNFMIILVDGDTTYGTAIEKIVKEISVSGSNNTNSDKKDQVLYPGTDRERIYKYKRTVESGFWFWKTYTHYFELDVSDYIDYMVELDRNVSDDVTTNNSGNLLSTRPFYSIGDNNYKPGGKVIGYGNSDTGNYGTNYVKTIGGLIQEYRETRENIEVFIIGFSPDATPAGLQDIADATKATHGTDGTHYKYYRANTAEALETVLNEIKFQISEALWHIGGPN